MHPRTHSLAGLVLLFAGAACSTTPRTSTSRLDSVPTAFVAWLCADACRSEFAGADPLPYHAMAPASRLADGSYEIRYQRRVDGRWAAKAEGRLLAVPSEDHTLPHEVRYEPSRGLLGFRAADAEVVVVVRATADGPAMQWTSTGFDSASVVRHLEAATAFASGLARGRDPLLRPCCALHAPWRAQLLMRLARERLQRGDLLAARDALLQAQADAPRATRLDHQIGAIDQALGQDELAARRLSAASRGSDDPFARAIAVQGAMRAESRLRLPDGASLREAAVDQLDRGRGESARALALAARSTDPDPISDLRLRHRLLRENGDARGSLGTALLLREYGAGAFVDQLLAQDFEQSGQRSLADRATARLLLSLVPQPVLRRWQRDSRQWLAGKLQTFFPGDLASPAR
ncbi:MAG: hypothetical protein ABL997_08280 [Planctomycetota bacterium]